jgi:hypothetical protein
MTQNTTMRTAEHVSQGHPDKAADQFADSILDAILDAAEHSGSHAAYLLFGPFAMMAGLSFIGSVAASLPLRRNKRPGHHHVAV